MVTQSPMKVVLLVLLAVAALRAPVVMQFLSTQLWPLGFFPLTDTSLYHACVDYYRASLPKVPATPVREVPVEGLTKEDVVRLTENFRYPLVVRGAIPYENIEPLGKRETWTKNYSKDDDWMICSDNAFRDYFKCSPKEIMDDYNNNSSPHPDMLRCQASHYILYNNPDLLDATYTPVSDFMPIGNFFPTEKKAIHEVFIGVEGTRTPFHGEMGLNLFKQISGAKKWLLTDPKYTFITGMVNNERNEGSTLRTTRDMVVYTDDPWFDVVPRQETTLQAGDVLIIPFWWGHAIDNIPTDPPSELNIGFPERYGYMKNSFQNSLFLTVNSMARKVTSIAWTRATDYMSGTRRMLSQDHFPLKEGDNAEKFDNFLIDNSIVKSTSGIRD